MINTNMSSLDARIAAGGPTDELTAVSGHQLMAVVEQSLDVAGGVDLRSFFKPTLMRRNGCGRTTTTANATISDKRD